MTTCTWLQKALAEGSGHWPDRRESAKDKWLAAEPQKKKKGPLEPAVGSKGTKRQVN